MMSGHRGPLFERLKGIDKGKINDNGYKATDAVR